MSQHFVEGYFTTENNIHGLSTGEIEARLGLPKGRMDDGANIWWLIRDPKPGEFEAHGSTLLPGGAGLTPASRTALSPVPGAWLNRRLVKVRPIREGTANDVYPPATGTRAEQWCLRPGIRIGARLLGELRRGQRWWGGRP